MRTLPEIVADMKSLIAEFEEHTGLPQKESYKQDSPYTIVSDDTITFNFDDMNAGNYNFSDYENTMAFSGDIVLDLTSEYGKTAKN